MDLVCAFKKGVLKETGVVVAVLKSVVFHGTEKGIKVVGMIWLRLFSGLEWTLYIDLL